MKNTLQDQHNTHDIKPTNLVSNESKTLHPNNAAETPIPDSGLVSMSSNGSRKVSRDDIEFVQNLIERCLQLYMNRDEVVKILLNRAGIEPGFTTLVWQKLEEENADFFRAYYIRLKLKKQIVLFNHFLQHQYHVMKNSVPPKVPLATMQNGVHPMAVNNLLPVGYPVMQQPPIPCTGQPHIDPMIYSASSCHVVNGVPAPRNFHPIRMNSGNDMAIETSIAEGSPNMPVSPGSAASSGHFPFSASEVSGIGVDTSVLDTAFTSDVASSAGLQLPPDNGAGNLAQIPWNFSLSDLTADLSNLGDLGALGNYPGSPFLPCDSDILLESPEQENICKKEEIPSLRFLSKFGCLRCVLVLIRGCTRGSFVLTFGAVVVDFSRRILC